ncbi:PREDICTED: uncharacterized protein LOC108580122 isoform X2 [Habropoda laboriosa]|uniref:uncharacterized protein LOC108580122 isoform X2 n=1 Tax=Habropoda laboriosa TaxID=597456 RepID=UPI00083D620B|nr:PREDICTED: uncharacterized protein LOC108580122 isoform X2 [Habropoda laboriosa]
MMQVHVTLLVFAVILVVSIESKPTWPDLYLNNYQYPSETIAVEPQLLHYKTPSYYVYSVQTDMNVIPTAVLANGKPSHVPDYSLYYGAPVYDLRFPLNPVYPVLKPVQPGKPPKSTPPSTTTMKPNEGSEDGIEKLDTKVEPEEEKKKLNYNEENSDKDSITVEAV